MEDSAGTCNRLGAVLKPLEGMLEAISGQLDEVYI